MANKEWHIGDIVNEAEYTDAAVFCNESQTMHIEQQNGQYVIVENPTYVPTIEDQIYDLENQITARNVRSAILGDEFAINKMTEIEEQIEELRRQLEAQP